MLEFRGLLAGDAMLNQICTCLATSGINSRKLPLNTIITGGLLIHIDTAIQTILNFLPTFPATRTLLERIVPLSTGIALNLQCSVDYTT